MLVPLLGRLVQTGEGEAGEARELTMGDLHDLVEKAHGLRPCALRLQELRLGGQTFKVRLLF